MDIPASCNSFGEVQLCLLPMYGPVLLFPCRNKDILVRAEEEQRKVIASRGTGLDFDTLSEMAHLHRCMKEVLRLHPPLIMLLRYCKQPFK